LKGLKNAGEGGSNVAILRPFWKISQRKGGIGQRVRWPGGGKHEERNDEKERKGVLNDRHVVGLSSASQVSEDREASARTTW